MSSLDQSRPARLTGDAPARLSGRLDADGVAELWTPLMALATQGRKLTVDAAEVTYFDGAGAAMLVRLEIACVEAGGRLTVTGLPPEAESLLALYRDVAPENIARAAAPRDDDAEDKPLPQQDVVPLVTAEEAKDPTDFISTVGMKAVAAVHNFAAFVVFVGALAATLGAAVRHPRKVRWKDVWLVAEDAGVLGLPIISGIGFLMGLIMAFQSAIPMERFGAELYVADLLGISMIREMGALVTAIMLTGRSGSAYAAELGTMVVGEEVNALKTMGLSPMQFLALPRILGTMLVMPALTAFFVLWSFVGGALVVMSFGYPLVTYAQRLTALVGLGDLAQGLSKSLIFALVVAAVGCHRGLSTGMGASAVGQSTTASVVTGLTLIAVLDGVFAAAFYALGI